MLIKVVHRAAVLASEDKKRPRHSNLLQLTVRAHVKISWMDWEKRNKYRCILSVRNDDIHLLSRSKWEKGRERDVKRVCHKQGLSKHGQAQCTYYSYLAMHSIRLFVCCLLAKWREFWECFSFLFQVREIYGCIHFVSRQVRACVCR